MTPISQFFMKLTFAIYYTPISARPWASTSHVVLILQRGNLKLTEMKWASQVTQALNGELAFGPGRF